MGASFIVLFLITFTTLLALSNAFTPQFFYLSLEWPGSQCATKEGCCFPKTVKLPKDFTISRFQPFDGLNTQPTHCNDSQKFNISKITDFTTSLEKHWPSLTCPSSDSKNLWSNEWSTYGTCTLFDQHQYFKTAIKLKKRANLLQTLANAGIQPNGSTYSRDVIIDVIRTIATISGPGLDCKKDKNGNYQLYRVIFCSDYNGKNIVECPGISTGQCGPNLKFPPFKG